MILGTSNGDDTSNILTAFDDGDPRIDSGALCDGGVEFVDNAVTAIVSILSELRGFEGQSVVEGCGVHTAPIVPISSLYTRLLVALSVRQDDGNDANSYTFSISSSTEG